VTPPLSIDGYELGPLLGAGRLGPVHAARRLLASRKAAMTAAVRVLDPAVVQDRERTRGFLNEALAASAIGHPGIVEVLDLGELPDGHPYLVQELLAGESLAAVLDRRGALPAHEAVALVRQAASAVAAAHAEGIVHGELGPRKIVVLAGGRGVKVRDFGMGRLALPGSSPCLAPERRAGGAELDPRGDVYALGALLQLCLPRDRAAPALQAVVLRATAEQPGDRYPSAAELAQALADAEVVPAPPPATSRKRRRVTLAGAAAVVVAGLWAGLTPQGNVVLARGCALVRSLAAPLLGTDAVTSKGALPGHR
jgi:serine/threonine protein kinase